MDLSLVSTQELLDELNMRFAVLEAGENQQNIAQETETESEEKAVTERTLPEGKRVVRTRTTGDRVYMIDEEKKSRHWVTNPQVLTDLGFTPQDVDEISDEEMLKYQQGQAIYRVDA